MKLLFLIILVSVSAVFSASLFAAPLETGHALAPGASASPEERTQAFMNARLRVIEEAIKYAGTPYRFGGLSTSGLDCSGLLILSFRDALGASLPRSASSLYSWVVRIPVERVQPGDLVFFRTGSTNNITHVGLYIGNRRFIHAASAGSQTGVIYSSLNEQYYIQTFAGAGRAFPEAPSDFSTIVSMLLQLN
jgi:probable lipoprotein NlpC